jgi:hypothetical protein
MVRSHRVSVAMHVPVAQILTTERRFLLQNCGNPVYLEADLEMKERALQKLTPIGDQGARYIADDPLLIFLSSL